MTLPPPAVPPARDGAAAPSAGPSGPGTLVLLIALTAVGQLGYNLPLPALALIEPALGLDRDGGAAVLSTYLVGLALGLLAAGPLADRVGRRPVLCWGLALFSVAAVGATFANSATMLFAFRVMQGIGASAGVALGRAVARDLDAGPTLVRTITRITMAMAVVPGLAPVFGGLLAERLGWGSTFGVAGIVGAILLTITWWSLPETNRSLQPGLGVRDVLRTYAELMSRPAFIRNAVSSGLALAALYAFFTGAALALAGPGGLTPSQFGLVPITTAFPYVFGGWMLMRASDRPAARRAVVIVARLATLIGPVLLLGQGLTGKMEAWGVVAGTTVYALGLGAVLPIGSAGAVIPFPSQAGSASALLGALQMGLGTLAGAIIGWIGGAPAIVFPAVMLACVIGSVVIAPAEDLSPPGAT